MNQFYYTLLSSLLRIYFLYHSLFAVALKVALFCYQYNKKRREKELYIGRLITIGREKKMVSYNKKSNNDTKKKERNREIICLYKEGDHTVRNKEDLDSFLKTKTSILAL